MPRAHYITCPACNRRKGVEDAMLVGDNEHTVDVVRCMSCRARWKQEPS
jgi:predicted Zn finger-like uncharacterized protein